jgi:hypothetical protein
MTTIRVGYHRAHGLLLVGLGIVCSVLGMMSVSVTPRPTFATYGRCDAQDWAWFAAAVYFE